MGFSHGNKENPSYPLRPGGRLKRAGAEQKNYTAAEKIFDIFRAVLYHKTSLPGGEGKSQGVKGLGLEKS